MPVSTVIERGGSLRVEAWVSEFGDCPLIEFLEELLRGNPEAVAAFRVAVEKIHLTGRFPMSPEKVRLLNPKRHGIWELKIHKGPGYRFFFFRHGESRIVFTHGAKKPPERRVVVEVEKAVQIKSRLVSEGWS